MDLNDAEEIIRWFSIGTGALALFIPLSMSGWLHHDKFFALRALLVAALATTGVLALTIASVCGAISGLWEEIAKATFYSAVLLTLVLCVTMVTIAARRTPVPTRS